MLSISAQPFSNGAIVVRLRSERAAPSGTALSGASGSPRITHAAELPKPFTVAGEYGGAFGQQDGEFEAWLFPVKVLSGFNITAEVSEYST
jgi:hypothetical protein